jgi:hypothetical protein
MIKEIKLFISFLIYIVSACNLFVAIVFIGCADYWNFIITLVVAAVMLFQAEDAAQQGLYSAL